MAEQSLDQRILFQSFRHSQGIFSLQRYLFRYAELKIGYTPDLELSDEELRPYVRLLEGAETNCSASHLDISLHGASAKEEALMVFAQLRQPTHDDSEDLKTFTTVSTMPLEDVVANLAADILFRERVILNPHKPWVSKEEKEVYHRPDRLEHRVREGKASFLLYYGRDERPTGLEIYDEMYKDAWAQVGGKESYRDGLDELLRFVASREQEFIGRLVLAATPLSELSEVER